MHQLRLYFEINRGDGAKLRETIRSRKHFATITDQKFINSLSGLFLFAYARHMRGTPTGYKRKMSTDVKRRSPMDKFALDLQRFAEPAPGGDPAPTPAPTPAPSPIPSTSPAPATAAHASADDIVTALFSALESRTRRVESSVTKSYAQQYGMNEAELTALLDKAKADKAARLPTDVQARIDTQMKAANERLIAADIHSGVARSLRRIIHAIAIKPSAWTGAFLREYIIDIHVAIAMLT